MVEPPLAEGHRRHDLLDVEPEAWADAVARRSDLAGVPYITDWAQRERPVIVRRRNPDERRDLVPVGLPLPPRDGKRRIGFSLSPAAVRPRAPLFLSDAVEAGPPAWSATLAAILDLGASVGVPPRLFGGLLWQCLTGLNYLSGTSDLDLLWPCADVVAGNLLTGLAELDRRAPMRLDGEILLLDGGGVNWRELHDAGPDDAVLVKHLDRLVLRSACSVLAGRSE